MGIFTIVILAIMLALTGDFSAIVLILYAAAIIGIVLLFAAAPGLFVVIAVFVIVINLILSSN